MGIDPGTRRVGYGIIKKERGELRFVRAGLLKIKSREEYGALFDIKREFDRLIRLWRPSVLAIEKIYFSKNQKTGLQVAEARGVILLAAVEHGLLIREYAPNEVKLGLTGYGFADKKAVVKMVGLLLQKPGFKIIDDASDALALAIIASQRGLDNPKNCHILFQK